MEYFFQAKLRYDPVQLDPEEMCRMASEEPRVNHCCVQRLIIFIYALLLMPLGVSCLIH